MLRWGSRIRGCRWVPVTPGRTPDNCLWELLAHLTLLSPPWAAAPTSSYWSSLPSQTQAHTHAVPFPSSLLTDPLDRGSRGSRE